MAKVIVVNDSNIDLQGNNYTNYTSNTVFSWGRFSVTTNTDTSNSSSNNIINSFYQPISLSDLSSNDMVNIYDSNYILNIDKTNIDNFVRFGSASEFIRNSVENIILQYPYSIYVDYQNSDTIENTFYDYNYDPISNTAEFKVPVSVIKNIGGLIIKDGDLNSVDNNSYGNMNLSFSNYVIWSNLASDNIANVIGFTGYTKQNDYLILLVSGNPFPYYLITTNGFAKYSFHIRPNDLVFCEFKKSLNEYESYIINSRNDSYSGFVFKIKFPQENDEGEYENIARNLTWKTTDGYNIDISSSSYKAFYEAFINIGGMFDEYKTDIIYRYLMVDSIKNYDKTENDKIKTLLRIYGHEFDIIRKYVDSLGNINKLSYSKNNDMPDQLLGNFAEMMGWEYKSLIKERELVNNFFNVEKSSENKLPYEINFELWRRILLNTKLFSTSKGTRSAFKTIFLMLGIPDEIISLKEYVYTVNGVIDPNEVTLTIDDFPSNSLPYDDNGYPIAPTETNDFYFQMSGNSDNGQAYMDVFRSVGYDLEIYEDNKKSWVYDGFVERIDDTTPVYTQKHSDLVLNTKEIDVGIVPSRGIENDVFKYVVNNPLIVNNYYGFDSLSTMSFDNFIGNAIRYLINAKNRKVITDFNGGWYPTLMRLYTRYIEYQRFSENSIITEDNINEFIDLYSDIIYEYINKLLPSTVIIKNGGNLIKNNVFCRQKYTYRRGVYMGIVTNYGSTSGETTFITDSELQYLGNDGSLFVKKLTDEKFSWDDSSDSSICFELPIEFSGTFSDYECETPESDPTGTTTTTSTTTTTVAPTTTSTTTSTTTTTVAPTTTSTTTTTVAPIITCLSGYSIGDVISDMIVVNISTDGETMLLAAKNNVLSENNIVGFNSWNDANNTVSELIMYGLNSWRLPSKEEWAIIGSNSLFYDHIQYNELSVYWTNNEVDSTHSYGWWTTNNNEQIFTKTTTGIFAIPVIEINCSNIDIICDFDLTIESV